MECTDFKDNKKSCLEQDCIWVDTEKRKYCRKSKNKKDTKSIKTKKKTLDKDVDKFVLDNANYEDDHKIYKINFASRIYANNLNNNLMNYIKNFVDNCVKEDYILIPYTYFDFDHCEIDINNEMQEYNYIYSNEINNFIVGKKEFLYDSDISNMSESYSELQKIAGIKKYKKNIYYIGLIGITMRNREDIDDDASHYISFIYKNTVKNKKSFKKLYIFDSAGGKTWNKTLYYRMLMHHYNISENDMITNYGVFEHEGGASMNEYSYVAQNIFCHSWSLWFLFQFFVKKMGDEINIKKGQLISIDKKAGKGTFKNKHNLINIKNFIWSQLIPLMNMKFKKKIEKKIFNDNFKYIYLNDIDKIEKIID